MWGKGLQIVKNEASKESHRRYLYNHVYHDMREIRYSDIDDIVMEHLGEDISKYVSDRTIEKFSSKAK